MYIDVKKIFISEHRSSWEACSKTTLFNASHAAYILLDQCEIASSTPDKLRDLQCGKIAYEITSQDYTGIVILYFLVFM